MCVSVSLFDDSADSLSGFVSACLCHSHWNAIMFVITAFVFNVSGVVLVAFYHRSDLIILLFVLHYESLRGFMLCSNGEALE